MVSSNILRSSSRSIFFDKSELLGSEVVHVCLGVLEPFEQLFLELNPFALDTEKVGQKGLGQTDPCTSHHG